MSKWILAIDDEPSLQLLLEDFLELQGYSVTVLPDGSQLFTMLEKVQPDLLLLDLKLPGQDGFTLLSQLQESEWATLPVVVFSAYGFESAQQRAFDLGVREYLIKPAEPVQLLEGIERALSVPVVLAGR